MPADTMPEVEPDQIEPDSANEQTPGGEVSAHEQIELDEVRSEKVRIVEVQKKKTGEVLRRDCYDPDGGPAEIGDVMRLKDGELYLRTINWAESRSLREEPELRWEPTGLTQEEIARIGIFTWPAREPVRVFVDEQSTTG